MGSDQLLEVDNHMAAETALLAVRLGDIGSAVEAAAAAAAEAEGIHHVARFHKTSYREIKSNTSQYVDRIKDLWFPPVGGS